MGARLAVEAQRHEIEEGVLLEAAPGFALDVVYTDSLIFYR